MRIEPTEGALSAQRSRSSGSCHQPLPPTKRGPRLKDVHSSRCCCTLTGRSSCGASGGAWRCSCEQSEDEERCGEHKCGSAYWQGKARGRAAAIVAATLPTFCFCFCCAATPTRTQCRRRLRSSLLPSAAGWRGQPHQQHASLPGKASEPPPAMPPRSVSSERQQQQQHVWERTERPAAFPSCCSSLTLLLPSMRAMRRGLWRVRTECGCPCACGSTAGSGGSASSSWRASS